MKHNGSCRAGVTRGETGTILPFVREAALVVGAVEPVLVTAMVVRVSPSKQRADALRIGVRVTARLPGGEGSIAGPFVLVVDRIPFGLSTTETRDAIVAGVRTQLAERLLEWGGHGPVDVQVFGGVMA